MNANNKLKITTKKSRRKKIGICSILGRIRIRIKMKRIRNTGSFNVPQRRGGEIKLSISDQTNLNYMIYKDHIFMFKV